MWESNRFPNWLLVSCAIALLSSCANPGPPLTKDEYNPLSQKVYQGLTGAELLDSVEKIFLLADGDSFKIEKKPVLPGTLSSSLLANRQRSGLESLFLTIQMDYWRIIAIEGVGLTRIKVQLATESNITTDPHGFFSSANLVTSPALYDIFWARLDYFSDRRNDWMDCESMEIKIKQGVTFGPIDSLCGPGMSNDTPDRISGSLGVDEQKELHSQTVLKEAWNKANARKFKQGVTAFEKGDHETALEHFRPLAEQGMTAAQNYLAFMYTHGLGVDQDYTRAYMWGTISESSGNIDAPYGLWDLQDVMTEQEISRAKVLASECKTRKLINC
jgi:hypothetical protein